MNSKLVASACNKVRSCFAYGHDSGSEVLKHPIPSLGRRFFGMVPMLLACCLMALLTIPTTAQVECQLTCDDQKNISIGTNGYSTIFPELVINGDFSCATPITVEVIDEGGISLGNRVDCEQVGKTLTVKVTGNNEERCWSSIKIESKLAASIQCVDLFVPCIESVHPDSIGYPSLLNVCDTTLSVDDLNYFDILTQLPCGTIVEGREVNARITRSWTIVDKFNNTGTCTQNIYLLKGYINNVVFPPNMDGIDQPALNCASDPNDLSITGAPTFNDLPIETGGFCQVYVNHQDQTIDICPPSSYRILRRWEVIDLCTKEQRIHLQDIILADKTGPTLICPDSFSVNANSVDCSALVILPQATAYDSCSNVVVQPSWEFGTGYGPFSNVPSGTHDVTYTATDQCGNTTVCTTKLTVVDNTKPIAVCRDQVHIALSTNGIATIDAIVFDGGSRDNCSINKVEAKRDDTTTVFTESLTFTCNDLNKVHDIILKISDHAGNNNECRSQLIVDDEILPTITCPPTISVECQSAYRDVDLTGVANAADDCGVDSLFWVDDLQFNACGTSGTLLRHWFARDFSGNVGSCTQVIMVVDTTALEITFPAEYTTTECNSDLSSDVTGYPSLTGDDCESILISHEDKVLSLGGSSCYQILRTWNIIDWCKFNGTDGTNGGLTTHTQIINVLDWTAPQITFCPPNIEVEIEDFECETQVQLTSISATDCSDILIYTNDSPFANQHNENASGTYPLGTTTVNYTISDGCGNVNSCQTNIVVKDAHAPTPVCKHSISIALRNDGTVVVPHNAINSGSYDNCGIANELTYEISPNYFTCEDIGQQTINLIVTDKSGNSDFCTTDIFIQDNHGGCNPTSLAAIGGKISTELGNAMEEVAVEISGGMSDMSYTNTNGEYLFEKLSKLASYTVRPVTTSERIKEGVSTFDVVLIQKHILGIETLDSPYKLIAADINRSGSISTFDVVQLRSLILGITDEFENNQSWRFVLSDYEFPDENNPFLEVFPESVDYSRLFGNKQERDFVAIKIGDVNNSISSFRTEGTPRNQLSPFQLAMKDEYFEANQTYQIPIYAEDLQNVAGYQFALRFNTDLFQIENVQPNETNEMTLNNFGLTFLEKGLLTTSWHQVSQSLSTDNNILFTLNINTKQAFHLSDAISIQPSIIEPEAYDLYGEILGVNLDFQRQTTELFQNQPNPFQQTTKIGFRLAEATSGVLSVRDINGRVLKIYKRHFNKGYNEVLVDAEELNSEGGLFYYQLETPLTGRLSRKMLLIK